MLKDSVYDWYKNFDIPVKVKAQKDCQENDWFALLLFYGISTLVGYLMPNPVFTYTLNIHDLFTHFLETHR